MDTIELILFKFRNLLHRLEHPIRQQIKLVMHLAGGLLAHNFENAAVLEVPKRRCPLLRCATVGTLSRLCRFLSSAEVSTALRPFYFSVHPDLFGRYPAERTVNENSLKQLSSYLETLLQNRPTRPTTVTFYLRNQNTSDSGTFRTVRISLMQRDLRKTVLSILKSCDLPTTYVDNIEPPPPKSRFEGLDMKEAKFDENDPVYGSVILKQKIKKFKDAEKTWLENNVSEALKKLAACQPVREELVRLQKVLCDTLGIESVVWDCGWNVTHFRGCLQSFQALAHHHPDLMHTLRGN
ncbi:hypothetical protein Cfor_04515 [Coptotermes formosanus]|uniref:DUF4460 domain-containing protein n=1 Tax=Coptotermes formosanus TaxID=36987 RepID=A0A6L2Q9N1_COPFO|nr:hypothetical protein Cfor_04515 [Coptotermes formosanus]